MSPDSKNQSKKEFIQAMSSVTPLRHDKVPLKRIKDQPITIPSSKTPESHHSMPNIENPDIANAADTIEYKPPGINRKSFTHLKRGQYNIQATLDLHGLTINQSKTLFLQFMHSCKTHYHQHVLIIHGKGSHNSNSAPIIKNKVNQWLRSQSNVLAFCSAQPKHGGSGAVYVLLNRKV